MKTIINIDKVRICLLQPEKFYDSLYDKYHDSLNKEVRYDSYGFYLSFENDDKVNDKDITAKLFLIDDTPVELGTFVFNKSAKYGTKCFFSFNTIALYSVAGHIYEGREVGFSKYNYFVFPFNVFDNLGLEFNNVTSVEIACDTEASIINRIQYAVGKPEVFDMILLWKKVNNPYEILDGYWEYYQRSRVKKAPRPSLYIHSSRNDAGNNCTLKVYDKARELLQARPDKETLIRAWNGMGNRIQRMEVSVENKQFKRFFEGMNKKYPNRWLANTGASTREKKQEAYRQGLEHFFIDLGLDESLRGEMFSYFANHLLHFKLRNHEKTQISVLDLLVNSLKSLRELSKESAQ